MSSYRFPFSNVRGQRGSPLPLSVCRDWLPCGVHQRSAWWLLMETTVGRVCHLSSLGEFGRHSGWLAQIRVAQMPGLLTSKGETWGDVLPQVTSWQWGHEHCHRLASSVDVCLEHLKMSPMFISRENPTPSWKRDVLWATGSHLCASSPYLLCHLKCVHNDSWWSHEQL